MPFITESKRQPADWSQHLAVAGLYGFSLGAFLSTALAHLGLALILAAMLVQWRVSWPVLRDAWSVRFTGLLLAYLAIRTVLAAYVQQDLAELHTSDGNRLMKLCLFPLVAWCLAGDQRRLLAAAGLALAGFMLGRLGHLDWATVLDPAWWQGRPGLGFPAIALGEYAAACGLGLVVMAPRLWRRMASTPWRIPLVLVWLLLVLASLELFVLSQARGVWLALSLTVPALLVLHAVLTRRIGLRWLLLVLGAGMALALLLALNRETLLARMELEAGSVNSLLHGDLTALPYDSVGIRARMWVLGFQSWLEYPWFGAGPGVSAWLLQQTGDPVLMSFNDLHNAYLEVLVRLGVTGGLLFLSTLALACLPLWRAHREGRVAHDVFLLFSGLLLLHLLAAATNFRMLNTDWRFYWLLVGGATSSFAFARAPR